MKDEEHDKMKNYEVALMATAYKTVKISADSEQDAMQMAHDIYFQTDALNFTDEDVDEIAVQADELEDDEPDCRGDCMHCHDDRFIKCPMRCRTPDCDDMKYLHLQEDFAECVREAHFAINDFERVMEAIETYCKGNRS